MAYIQVVRVCNQACRFCSNPENGQELPFAEAAALVDDYAAKGFDALVITGGEPTLYAPLFELIAHADARGIASRIITNAQKTAERGYLVSLVKAGLTHLHVSVHTHKPALQAHLAGRADSFKNIVQTLNWCKRLPVTVDLNQTVCAQNADHLDATIAWMIERFPYIRHISWNYLDPFQNRVAENPDVIPRLRDSERALLAAMRYLDASGRTFRIEKLPLCYMGDYAHCSTETRAIVKRDARTVRFLDERAEVTRWMWHYGKGDACEGCSLSEICAGLWDCGGAYDPAELRTQTRDPQAIIDRILAKP